jgi:hypothetical protein
MSSATTHPLDRWADIRGKPRGPNRYRGLCECGEHAWTVLTRGYVAMVSPQHAELLASRNWQAYLKDRRIYAHGKIGGKKVWLQRKILGELSPNIDHRDHDGTNNRRENLRPCSKRQNNGNSRHRVSTSGFRGVHKHHSERWVVNVAGKTLGVFDTPEEAARVRDAAAIERWGEFAVLNFPPEGAA